ATAALCREVQSNCDHAYEPVLPSIVRNEARMRQSRSGSRIAWIKGEASELMGETTAIDVAMEAAHPVRVEEYRTAKSGIAMAAGLLRSERLMEMIRILAASRCASASNSGYSKRPIVATSVARAWSPGAPNPALGAPAAVLCTSASVEVSLAAAH